MHERPPSPGAEGKALPAIPEVSPFGLLSAAPPEAALDATQRGNASDFVTSIAHQVTTLNALGQAAGVNIVTAELAELARLASAQGATFLPAGAGGGDVAYCGGSSSAPAAFATRARELGFVARDSRAGRPRRARGSLSQA